MSESSDFVHLDLSDVTADERKSSNQNKPSESEEFDLYSATDSSDDFLHVQSRKRDLTERREDSGRREVNISGSEDGTDSNDEFLDALQKGKLDFEKKEDDVTQAIGPEPAMPQPPTPKPIRFGENVEQVRAEIVRRRQACQTKLEFDRLQSDIDFYRQQAIDENHPVIAIRFLIDKAITSHFGLDFESAMEQANQAIISVRNLENASEGFGLELTANFVLCSVFSRQKDYGKAWGLLQDISQQIAGSTNSVDHWRLHYNMGTNRLGQLKASFTRSDRVLKAGVEYFQRCRDAIADGESRGQMYDIENHFYALVMAAKMQLDLPELKAKRELKGIPNDQLKEASKLLAIICSDYPFTKWPIRFKIRTHITFAGLYFRIGQNFARSGQKEMEHRNFIHALLFLEASHHLGKGTPYEETQIVEEFLDHLRGLADVSVVNAKVHFTPENVFRVDKNASDSEPELEERDEELSESDYSDPRGMSWRKVCKLRNI